MVKRPNLPPKSGLSDSGKYRPGLIPSSGKKSKRKGHPANCFILFFLTYWKRCGGNIYQVARCCGQKWKTLPQSEKDKYRKMYCSKVKVSRVCGRPPKSRPAATGGSAGKKGGASGGSKKKKTGGGGKSGGSGGGGKKC